MVLLAADADGLWLFVALRIGIERTCLQVDDHPRVGTHIYRALYPRLQKLDVNAKLILVSPPCRVIQIQVELSDILLLRRQPSIILLPSYIILLKQLASAHNLHTAP